MTVQDLLVNMESAAFGGEFLQAIQGFYHASLQRLDDDTIEQDYLSAKAHFDATLSQEQKAKIEKIEALYAASLSYSAKYGFKCGIYCGFRQYFVADTEPDAGFNNILCQDLLTQPRMQRHRENYYSNIHPDGSNNLIDRWLSEKENAGKDQYGNPNLGINASNEEFLKLHPNWARETLQTISFI